MPPLMKLIVGLLGVGALTWLFLGPLGSAQAVADDLENRARAALEGEHGEIVQVSVPRNPVRRSIQLSGDLPDDARAEARELVAALPGVSDAVWLETDSGDASEELAQTVASCQQELTAIMTEDRIQFRSGSAYINPASARLIDRIAETATDCEGTIILIEGHTDSSGSEGVNMEMSAFRATAVRDALVERGVPQAMLRTEGKGSSEPLGENPADPANRRIEFRVSAADNPAEGGA